MTEIVSNQLDSGYLTDEEKNELERAFNTVLKLLNLDYKLKNILVTYPFEADINEHNRAEVIFHRNQFNNKTVEFETLKQYIFEGKKANVKLIRHELMHIKDIFDPLFKHSYNQEEKVRLEKQLFSYMMIIWNIYIDSRLIEDYKLESSMNKHDRKEEFKRNLRKAYNEAWFEKLWEKRNATFESLINEGRKVLEKLS